MLSLNKMQIGGSCFTCFIDQTICVAVCKYVYFCCKVGYWHVQPASCGQLGNLLFLLWFIFQLPRLLTDTDRNKGKMMVLNVICTVSIRVPVLLLQGPGSYSRNNEPLFCYIAVYQTSIHKKRDFRGQGLALACFLPVSHKLHTHTFLFLSYCTSQVCRGHHGNLVFCRKRPRCCDEVSTKAYWSTRFGACLKEKSCSVLLRLVIDMKKSLETNLTNWYSWAIQSLWVCVYGLFLACSLFQ